jgi:hypothetical protein
MSEVDFKRFLENAFRACRAVAKPELHFTFVILPGGSMSFRTRQLRLVAVPGILFSRDVRIEHWLMLELILPKTPGKGVFRSDDLAPDFEAGGLH